MDASELYSSLEARRPTGVRTVTPSSKGKRSDLLKSLAELVSDYREGEVEVPTAEHIERWLDQFEEDEETKTAFLSETYEVLRKTYVSKKHSIRFLSKLAEADKLVGKDARALWKKANVLNIQQRGNSQAELRELFGKVLEKNFGLSVDDCSSAAGPFIYLDDAIFTGTHVLSDIREWTANAPEKATLHIVAMAVYSGGEYSIGKSIPEILKRSKKSLQYHIWRAKTYQNYSTIGGASDVLRLKKYPDGDASRQFIEDYGEGKAPAYMRPENEPNTSDLFSSEERRDLLERVYWKAGLQIRERCPHLKVMHRPLGYTTTNSANKLGFGSMFVSYRNCANNTPLALWTGDPWYALFERKINE
jgi:hypothetical protein